MTEEWKSKKESFDAIDGRGEAGNFLPVVLKRAETVAVGEGLCVVQSFEPIPLYSTLEDLGFEHMTDKALGKIAGHFWQLTWKKDKSFCVISRLSSD